LTRRCRRQAKAGGVSVETGVQQPEEEKGVGEKKEKAATAPRRFHGTVELDSERVGRDTSQIADEVIALEQPCRR